MTQQSIGGGENGPIAHDFANFLDRFLTNGVRPDTVASGQVKSWENREFALAVGSVNERSVRNWRRGANLPSDLWAIERALFGDQKHHQELKAQLRAAYEAAKVAANGSSAVGSPAISREQTPFPPAPPRCFGREKEISQLLDAVKDVSSKARVVVLGGPGIGKTTLILAVANRPQVVKAYSSRRWFVRLETAKTPEAMEDAIIRAVGLDPGSDRFASALVRLEQGPALIVLDNLETPWEANREAVENRLALLAAAPDVAIIASFRGHDAVLGVRWSHEISLPPLVDSDARALFLDFARKIPEDDPHLTDLLAVLGGVPLAVSLVAQRAAQRERALESWEEWQRVGAAFACRPGVEPMPRTSVDHSIDLSLQSCRLHDAGRRLFRWLGQLPAGMSRADRAALLGNDAFNAESEILAVGLAEIIGERLDLLPPVRDFATRHEIPKDKDAERWRGHYLGIACDEAAEIGFSYSVGMVERLALEQPNIEAAVLAALAADELSSAMEALDGIYRLMAATGNGSLTLISQFADACHAANDEIGEANCLRRLGNLNRWRSHFDPAHTALTQALAIYRKRGNPLGEANCIKGLADMVLEYKDYGAAQGSFEDAMKLYQATGTPLGEADCFLGLGQIFRALGDHTAAKEALRKAQLIYKASRGVLGQANCIKAFGDIALAESDHATARERYSEARQLFHRVGNKLGLGTTLSCLAEMTSGTIRDRLIMDARDAWTSINRLDLVSNLNIDGHEVPLSDAQAVMPAVDVELVHN